MYLYNIIYNINIDRKGNIHELNKRSFSNLETVKSSVCQSFNRREKLKERNEKKRKVEELFAKFFDAP